jgi:hypothetical protein
MISDSVSWYVLTNSTPPSKVLRIATWFLKMMCIKENAAALTAMRSHPLKKVHGSDGTKLSPKIQVVGYMTAGVH